MQVYDTLGVKPNIIHIAADLLAAWDDTYTGTLTGDKSNSVVFDNSKIKRFVPEFDCKVSWAEGVKRVIDWFDADPARRSVDQAEVQKWDAIIAAYLKSYPIRH